MDTTNLSTSDHLIDSIFRFHVRVNGKRTTISLDPQLFQALTYKLGSSSKAKEWINNETDNITKNGSISRSLQGRIALFLVGVGQQNIGTPHCPAAQEDDNPL